MRAVALVLFLALAACAGSGGPPKPNKRQMAVIDRALASAPGAAQPSTVVAAELAFSRAALEKGQWTAFRLFAAPGAMLHGGNGPFAIAPWLATQTDPPQAVQWKPRVVVMSCDGALAVSQGATAIRKARSAISRPSGNGSPPANTAMSSMPAATTCPSPLRAR